MKRKLKVSVDTLLHHVSVPELDLKSTKSARRQLYMEAVSAKHAKRSLSGSGQFWRAGRGALVFAGVSLFVLIGASSLIAMSGRAQPGHPLYSLNRAWERTQLALTQDEVSKLELKLAFAEERLSEVAAIELTPTGLTNEVVSSTEDALSEIDDELDKAKLALEFGEQTDLSRDEVEQISSQFKQVMQSYQLDISEIFQLSKDENAETELAEAAVAISDVADSLLAEPITQGEGYYLQLKGKLSADGKEFSTLGYELNLAGSMNASAMADLDVKVDGWVSQQSLSPEIVAYEDFQLATGSDGGTIYSGSGQLQQDVSGYFVNGPKGQRVALTGQASEDERLVELVGQAIALSAIWQANDSAELMHVIVGEGDDAFVIPDIQDPDTAETGESLPATDPVQTEVPPPSFDE